MAKTRTYQQIESAADFYAPGVYELLPRFSNLLAMPDPLARDFVPLSSVGVRTAKDAKMFIIGIMPPTSNVTGRLLDRSASIAALTGEATEKAASVGQPADPPSDAFYDELVRTANRLGVKPEDLATVFNGESGTDPHQAKGRAKGLNQMLDTVAKSEKVGMPKEVWDNYQNLTGTEQLPWIERSLKPCAGKTDIEIYMANTGGYTDNPFPPNYQGTIGAIRYVSEVWVNKSGLPPSAYRALKNQYDGYAGNVGMDYNKDGCISDNDVRIQTENARRGINVGAINAAKTRVGNSTDSNFAADSLSGQALKDNWAGKGSAAASQSNKDKQKIADKDLNLSGLGRKLATAQLVMIKATQAALETMRNTPPLRMLVNPQSFKVGSEKIVADGNRSRSKTIIEHWGEQQDKIEASGKIAGFYAADMVGNATANSQSVTYNGGSATSPYPDTVGTYPGLTRSARNFSKSWQNFLSLFMIYRSNGGLFLTDFYEAAHSKDPNFADSILSVVGSIYIYYDNILYIGSFDTFSITESDTAPFTAEYSFAFSVRATFLLDSVDDPKFTYGAPKLFDASQSIPTVLQPPPDPRGYYSTMTDQDKAAAQETIAKNQTKPSNLGNGDPMGTLDGGVMNPPDLGSKNNAIKKR